MNVVIVDGDVSYPPSSGKRLRTLHPMLRLAARHTITYIARVQGSRDEAQATQSALVQHGIETILVDDPLPPKAGLGFLARLGLNTFSPYPYSVASHQSARMRQALADHAHRRKVDLWHVEWSPYVLALPPSACSLAVVNAHNVETLIWQRYAEAERHPLKRWYIRQQWRKWERFERHIFRTVGRVVAVSAEDAALVRKHFGVARVDVVDNGIDRSSYADVRGSRQAQDILFLGSLDWRPNLDGLRCLLAEVFPAVRAAVPTARLQIVGRKAPDWLRQQVAAMPGVELHADVPDVRPFLASSGVLAVPLRIGGGSRLKILEALACALPVVSTGVGAEGLALQAGRHFVQADEPADMAAALVRAIRDPEPIRALAERGRQVVLEQYDWDRLADKLEQSWQKCAQGEQSSELVGQA
jgi:glycosyltransferase involved in cell wall biosynthesis